MPDESENIDNLLERGEAGEHQGSFPLPSPSSTKFSGKYDDANNYVAPAQLTPSSTSRWWSSCFSNWTFLGSNRGTPEIQDPVINSFVRKFEDCPVGYPRLAVFIDSDENFALYRRFGYLQTRIILYKQDILRELEKELVQMDNDDNSNSKTAKRLKSREHDDSQSNDRKNLIQKITIAFNEYAEILKTAHEFAGYNRASARDYASVKNYFEMTPTIRQNEKYIYHKEDIVTLKPGRETAWLDALVETALQKFSCTLVRNIFCSKDLRLKTDPKKSNVILYSRTRINCAVSFIITFVILALLIVPIYILWHLTRRDKFDNRITAIIIGILLVSTLIFSGVLSLFTRAKRHEILAAAAGYCAVLVVFIGNIGQLST